MVKQNVDVSDRNVARLEMQRMEMTVPVCDINMNRSATNACVNLHSSCQISKVLRMTLNVVINFWCQLAETQLLSCLKKVMNCTRGL